MRERADYLADSDEEERRESWWHHEEVQRRHKVVLDVQIQLSSIQKWIFEFVAGAEHQHIS